MADETPSRWTWDRNDIVAASGAVLVIGGAALIYVPAALILAGVAMLAVALCNVRA